MKNFFVLVLCLTSIMSISSQDNYFKFNGVSDVLLRSLSRGSGGRAIAHDVGNILSLNHGNDFTGGMRLWGEIRIPNKLTLAQLYLQPTSENAGWHTTKIEYRGHSFRIGSPQGISTHNDVEIVPGTHASALRYTSLNLYTSSNLTDYVKIVQIHSAGDSFFNGGNVGIGTTTPKNKLDVAGTIRATEVKVETGWADFVFDKDYKLPSLEEVESYTNEHKRLPDIPSESQVKDEGVGLGEMQVKLLQKIEELTLYVIELNKKNIALQREIYDLKSKID